MRSTCNNFTLVYQEEGRLKYMLGILWCTWVYLLALVTVTIKVRREIEELAREMVKLGIARSRNHAYNIMIEFGLKEAKKLVERRKAVRRLVEEYMEKGLPYDNLPTVRDVEEERTR